VLDKLKKIKGLLFLSFAVIRILAAAVWNAMTREQGTGKTLGEGRRGEGSLAFMDRVCARRT